MRPATRKPGRRDRREAGQDFRRCSSWRTLMPWPCRTSPTSSMPGTRSGWSCDLARTEGLRPQPGVAARIAESCANDRRMMAQELAKLALYLDASPNAPKDLGQRGARRRRRGHGRRFPGHRGSCAGRRRARRSARRFRGIDSSGKEAIPIIRSLQRRLLMLAPIRARVDAGERLQAVMTSLGKSLFWKDKPMVEKMLATVGFGWPGAGFGAGGRAGAATDARRFAACRQRRLARNWSRSPGRRGGAKRA